MTSEKGWFGGGQQEASNVSASAGRLTALRPAQGYAEKEVPHPQVPVALGLEKRKLAPCNSLT